MIKSWLNKRKRIWKRKKKKNFFTISGKKDNFKNCTKLTLKHIKSEYIENENNIKLLFRVFSNIFNNIYKKYCHKKVQKWSHLRTNRIGLLRKLRNIFFWIKRWSEKNNGIILIHQFSFRFPFPTNQFDSKRFKMTCLEHVPMVR